MLILNAVSVKVLPFVTVWGALNAWHASSTVPDISAACEASPLPVTSPSVIALITTLRPEVSSSGAPQVGGVLFPSE